jgi:hypothetical protein
LTEGGQDFMRRNRRVWEVCNHDPSLCHRSEFVRRLCTYFPIQLIKVGGPAASQRTGGNLERRWRFEMENRLLGEGSSRCDGVKSSVVKIIGDLNLMWFKSRFKSYVI